MIPTVTALHQTGYLTDLDLHFARQVCKIAGDERQYVLLGAALASRVTNDGNVCAPIDRLAGRPVRQPDGQSIEEFSWPNESVWLAELAESPLVGDGSTPTPLVLKNGRLYLYRYWRYEQFLADEIADRAIKPTDDVDGNVLDACLTRLFPAGEDSENDQLRAARAVATSRLAIIIGGPGTGKTSTVVRILAVLIELAAAQKKPPPSVAMMAPTGKAALRLAESIGAHTLKTALPTEVTTIHRALGARPNRPTQFARGRGKPLAADVVIVDEASMVDVALMSKLLEAVPPHARLILLGDQDQLASVDAGTVLADICEANPKGRVVHLRHSYRFGPESGIGCLTRAINRGDESTAISSLLREDLPDIKLVEQVDRLSLSRFVEHYARTRFTEYLAETDPRKRLGRLGEFRILCAHRRGLLGSDALNALLEDMLRRRRLLPERAEWYDGRPVMVTRNDHQLGLYNGDVGIICSRGDGSGNLAALFESSTEGHRFLSLARLPPVETVFAMTVHKAQGSEFDEVLLVLPERRSPVVTRELLYTAVTRARQKVTIIGGRDVIAEAIRTPVERASGLREALKTRLKSG